MALRPLSDPRIYVAEFFGTMLLLISVVGSGIMGVNLSGGNVAIALLANAVATGCMLYVIISVFGGISGAHFNPAVSLSFWLQNDISLARAALYSIVQIAGGVFGVLVAHAMFGLDLIQTSTTARTGTSQWIAEIVATFGLLMVIFGGLRFKAEHVPAMVAVYITGAYWFTASTSFANPAVTIARSFTDTFSGIAPQDVGMFAAAQILTALVCAPLFGWLFNRAR
jgi:glycerol uptake facilitator-like aquaporin